jgi:hypothetical protein
MTTLTMRYIKGHFVVTSPDAPPMQVQVAPRSQGTGAKPHYPGSPSARVVRRNRKARPELFRRSGGPAVIRHVIH